MGALEAAGIANARARREPGRSDARRRSDAVLQDPLTLKGFDAPVTAYDMSRDGR
jgi:class 3 adenylate cyclase